MFPIGRASELSGVLIETIRYYEREGIVPKPDRTASGRRVYSSSDIGRLRFIKRCRDLGFSMAEARSLLGLTEDSDFNCANAREIAVHHLAGIRAKISELDRMELALNHLIEQCDRNDRNCPLLDELLSG